MQWRWRLREQITALAQAWRTRRALNALVVEVQQFVNCDNPAKKHRLRLEFNLLFQKVLHEKLYMCKNARKLKALQLMHQQNSADSSSISCLSLNASA